MSSAVLLNSFTQVSPKRGPQIAREARRNPLKP
jgi:hypothetical protein